ncbi:terminase large subunit domain-containing protein [Brevundimonas sp. FT23028]|uniref:terminase large subunit domain-containing protein n=1 Tax=Brevundimonas sp. FT23028 TaxID=3393748 RepID=UPI003B587A6B
MGKHFNSKHDDDAWRGWFGRWHAGETALALIREARVSMDTWNANARRLGMQIKDLPPDHPRRRAPAFGERPRDYRHRNSLLTEGQWADLFAKRAAGAPDRVLALEYGVTPATIGTQAKKRGLRREDLRSGESPSTAARSPSPRGGEETRLLTAGGAAPSTTLRGVPLPTCGGEVSARTVREPAPLHPPTPAAPDGPVVGSTSSLLPPPPQGEELSEIDLAGLGVRIRRGDWAGTADSFDSGVEAAGARGDFHGVVALCRAKESVKRAMFGAGAETPSPASRSPSPSPGDGEETTGVAGPPLVLRAAQRAPAGDWATWLFLGGRGAGKTLAGAMWLAEMADRAGPGGRLALIGPTLHDVREVMIEGVSGIRSLARWGDGARPVFEASRRRLVFPNGAVAQAFSAEDPDSLRGPQFSAAWADEFCAWKKGGEVLALLRMGLRLALPAGKGADARLAEVSGLSADNMPESSPSPSMGEGRGGGEGCLVEYAAREAVSGDGASCATPSLTERAPPSPTLPPSRGKGGHPLLCVTTTPRPTAALRALRAEASCVETHAGTADNAAHLSPGFLAGLEALYGGTRRAAQEIEGKVVEGEGALFSAEMLARARSHPAGAYRPSDYLRPRTPGAPQAADDRSGTGGRAPVKFDRIIVAIDPTTSAGGNACGIVAAGRSGDRAVVLADRSQAGLSPEGWARRAMRTAAEFGATVLVAEVNQGGEMVRAVLKAAGSTLTLREVRATKGKRVRAEPVAALYEQGRVTHAGDFAALEEELMAFGGEDEAGCDLDRADALVWAITDLLIDRAGDPERGPRLTVLPGWAPVRRGLSYGL